MKQISASRSIGHLQFDTMASKEVPGESLSPMNKALTTGASVTQVSRFIRTP